MHVSGLSQRCCGAKCRIEPLSTSVIVPSHSGQNLDARCKHQRSHYFSYSKKQLRQLPFLYPSMGRCTHSMWLKWHICVSKNCGNTQFFSTVVCHAPFFAAEMRCCVEKLPVLQAFSTATHFWRTWCMGGALHACTTCTSSAICTHRCVGALQNAQHLHNWCA